MSRSISGRESRNVAFDMGVFLNQVLLDLKPFLGSAHGVLSSAVSNPSSFRSTIKKLLSDADCMDNTPRYAALRQVEACVSKLPSWGAASAKQRQATTLEKFQAAERRCRRVNRRLKHYSRFPGRLPTLVQQVIFGAQLELQRALGPVPCDDLLWEGCGFGPGTTFGFDRDFTIHRKLEGEQTVTPQARQLALNVLANQFPTWKAALISNPDKNRLSLVAGNRISFVPKSAIIDRTIGIEPSLNVFLQKGVDEYLKHQARHLGVRVTDQEYSIDCLKKQGARVSTIDLSSASDCISSGLVKWLFPADWYVLLDTLRSHSYTLDKGKTWSHYEKFSSMGNATTFPVESMLFASLARSACKVVGLGSELRSSVRVYGDDIIVPWECAALLIEVLSFLGFSTNSEKTFVFGPFRETCGVDLLNGVDVRPVYLRAIPTKPWQVAGFFNRLLSNRFGFSFHATLSYLFSRVDRPLTGPAYFGNSQLDTGCSVYNRDGWNAWYSGRNSIGDAYFWAPHAHFAPIVIKHDDHPHMLRSLKTWQAVRKIRKDTFYSESACYLSFLLGVKGGEPAGDVVVVEKDTVFFGEFPEVIYDFPAVYTAPVEMNDRTVRRLSQWVFGEA